MRSSVRLYILIAAAAATVLLYGCSKPTPSPTIVEESSHRYSGKSVDFWTVVASSHKAAGPKSEARAEQDAKTLEAKGITAFWAPSKTWSCLRPGYLVVFAGEHSTLKQAKALLQAVRDAGFPDAYTRHFSQDKTATGTDSVYGVAMPLEAKKMSFKLTVGERVFIQLPAAGGMPPYSWSLWNTGNVPAGYKAGLPDGLSLDPHGYLTGTLLAEPGKYYFGLMLQDSGGSSAVSEEYIVVYDLSNPEPDTNRGEGGPSMGGDPTPHGFEFSAATAYGRFGQGGYLQRGVADFTSDQFVYIVPFVHGGTRPWTFNISGLPEGLTYDPSTGIIQGTLGNVKKRTIIEVKSYLRDATGQVAYPETGSLYKFRVDYVESIPVVNSPTADKGTLSVSGGAGNTLSLNGIGVIGIGSAVVTLPAGSYTLTVTSPTGAQLYQGTVRIDAGKVTTTRISPW